MSSESPARRAMLAVPLLSLLWGLNWAAVRIALSEIPPWTLRAIGLSAGAVVLLAVALARARPLAVPRGHWPRLIVSGLLTVAGFNVLVTFAQLAATTSRAAIVTYTMPIWAVVLAWLALGERPDGKRWAAIAAAAAGLALLCLPLAAAGEFSAGIVYALGAGISWAAGTVYLKGRPIAGMALPVAAWQLSVGALVASVGMVAIEGWPGSARWSVDVWLALAYHVVFAIALGYLLWFEVIARMPAGAAALGTLMVPVVGVIGAVLILGERPTVPDIAGFALIMAAAVLALVPGRARASDSAGAAETRDPVGIDHASVLAEPVRASASAESTRSDRSSAP